jgi:hypothetical protein
MTYATTLDLDGYGRGVLVKTQDRRPIKIEGNPRHPASLGGTDVFAQADILSLYDPDRSWIAIGEGAERSLGEALSFLGSLGEDLRRSGAEGLALMTGPVSSPSLRRLIAANPARVPRRPLAPVCRGRQRSGSRRGGGRVRRAGRGRL